MFRDAASLYVGLGWAVFPLAAGSKLPAVKGGHGFKDASTDAEIIDAWDRQFPTANVGIATGEPSGVVVVDIDPRNGGTASMAKLAGAGLIFPPCPEAKTGNGGLHLFFKLPNGLRPSKDRLGSGIDIKATGGYVVAAPSWIAPSSQGSGGSYRWIVSPDAIALPPFPTWALRKLMPPPAPRPKFEPMVSTTEGARRSLEAMARRLASAGEGHRNNLLNWAAFNAGNLVRQGKIGASEVDARLTQAALAAGLSLPEIKATVASGLRGGGRP